MKSITGKICGDLRMPILFHMASRMPNIANHVATSQSMGRPSVLSRTLAGKIPNRAIAMQKCRSGNGLNTKANGFTSCDEYPFASTNEGGIGATTQFVPFREQLIQGGTISAFYSVCSRIADVPLYNEFVVIPVISAPKSFQCNYFWWCFYYMGMNKLPNEIEYLQGFIDELNSTEESEIDEDFDISNIIDAILVKYKGYKRDELKVAINQDKKILEEWTIVNALEKPLFLIGFLDASDELINIVYQTAD